MDSKVMRDVLIGKIHEKMLTDDNIFFLSADFGSPALDKLRAECGKRFINVGIAEQNLVNIATGLALEGYTVYAYAIAPFLTMRAYEQIRNISLLSQIKEININLIGVGIGLSYDVTGPTHHCLEDICIMRVLPNVVVFSPSDYVVTEKFVDYSLNVRVPKYIRLDGKAQPRIYHDAQKISIEQGFVELKVGNKAVIVSTGYMTHKALEVAKTLENDGIITGVVDIFMLKPVDDVLLYEALRKYSHIYTMEEGFINKGGLDSIVTNILNNLTQMKLTKFGFGDRYVFEVGNRDHLHRINGLDEENIEKIIKKDVMKGNL
ncbi:MAG TPA: transketolase [Ignavibacteriales bacterium]|nr:transketolase [Ignavibacteriales bacterium]